MPGAVSTGRSAIHAPSCRSRRPAESRAQHRRSVKIVSVNHRLWPFKSVVTWAFAGCYSAGAMSPYKRGAGGSSPPAPTHTRSDLRGRMPSGGAGAEGGGRAAEARAVQMTFQQLPDLAKHGVRVCYSSQ